VFRMSFVPTIDLTLINGFLWMIPIFLIRFGIAYRTNSKSLEKLQYFPEVIGIEVVALKSYLISNTLLIFSPLIFRFKISNLHYSGVLIYCMGIVFLWLSVISFSKNDGFVHEGIYRFSRNPMYIGYFFLFLGVGIMVASWLYLFLVIIYQISVHFLILSEERWCKQTFSDVYRTYMQSTRRYI